MLGLQGLGSSGGFERLHYLLESAFDGDDLSMAFKKVSLQLSNRLPVKADVSYIPGTFAVHLAAALA